MTFGKKGHMSVDTVTHRFIPQPVSFIPAAAGRVLIGRTMDNPSYHDVSSGFKSIKITTKSTKMILTAVKL